MHGIVILAGLGSTAAPSQWIFLILKFYNYFLCLNVLIYLDFSLLATSRASFLESVKKFITYFFGKSADSV